MRIIGWLVLTASIAGVAAPAEAGNWKDSWQEFCARFHLNYQRTRAWPEPFIQADRNAERAPWKIMEHNGWRAQNTLTEELFDDDGKLTEAGRRKVIWIATQAPEDRRTVYVLATHDQDATTVRTESVRELVGTLAESGVIPPQLMLTTRRPLRWSGGYFDQVAKKGQAAVKPPVLPAMQSTTNSGF